jgi:hypothetical protein
MPEKVRAAFSCRLVKLVLNGSVSATFYQKLHHSHTPMLSGHVERSDTLTVGQSAEGGLLVYVGVMVN